MATSVQTSLDVVNETDVRAQALLALIKQYIPGLRGCYYGYRPLGLRGVVLPCLMLEPLKQAAHMDRLGKYRLDISYALYFYVEEGNADATVSLATFVGEAMTKLLSNNALNDLNAANTGKYKTYAPYWLDSEMSSITWSTNFLDALTPGKFMRAGVMQFDISDIVTK